MSAFTADRIFGTCSLSETPRFGFSDGSNMDHLLSSFSFCVILLYIFWKHIIISLFYFFRFFFLNSMHFILAVCKR
jgi:hypothetical protein